MLFALLLLRLLRAMLLLGLTLLRLLLRGLRLLWLTLRKTSPSSSIP